MDHGIASGKIYLSSVFFRSLRFVNIFTCLQYTTSDGDQAILEREYAIDDHHILMCSLDPHPIDLAGATLLPAPTPVHSSPSVADSTGTHHDSENVDGTNRSQFGPSLKSSPHKQELNPAIRTTTIDTIRNFFQECSNEIKKFSADPDHQFAGMIW